MKIEVIVEVTKGEYKGIFKVKLSGHTEIISTNYQKNGEDILYHKQPKEVQHLLDTLVLADDIYKDITNIQNKF